jgi:hypothetical protein
MILNFKQINIGLIDTIFNLFCQFFYISQYKFFYFFYYYLNNYFFNNKKKSIRCNGLLLASTHK